MLQFYRVSANVLNTKETISQTMLIGPHQSINLDKGIQDFYRSFYAMVAIQV